MCRQQTCLFVHVYKPFYPCWCCKRVNGQLHIFIPLIGLMTLSVRLTQWGFMSSGVLHTTSSRINSFRGTFSCFISLSLFLFSFSLTYCASILFDFQAPFTSLHATPLSLLSTQLIRILAKPSIAMHSIALTSQSQHRAKYHIPYSTTQEKVQYQSLDSRVSSHSPILLFGICVHHTLSVSCCGSFTKNLGQLFTVCCRDVCIYILVYFGLAASIYYLVPRDGSARRYINKCVYACIHLEPTYKIQVR